MIITVRVTTLGNIFLFKKPFVVESDNWGSLRHRRKKEENERKKWTKPHRLVKSDFCALSLFMSFFRLHSIRFFRHSKFLQLYIVHVRRTERKAIQQQQQKTNNKRLKQAVDLICSVGND